ncbi:hypothetical protein GCM10007906_38450 [Vibrio hyugaensis]|uniref:Uncharacterized protein n=1 Tax=Vibrio hyugaensis TaxID=1534743 RepID=A0ABQ5Y9B7_9VIBR|nr:hypothetical protein GCM10007906_38450 [Vibrio hyugaensis]
MFTYASAMKKSILRSTKEQKIASKGDIIRAKQFKELMELTSKKTEHLHVLSFNFQQAFT